MAPSRRGRLLQVKIDGTSAAGMALLTGLAQSPPLPSFLPQIAEYEESVPESSDRFAIMARPTSETRSATPDDDGSGQSAASDQDIRQSLEGPDAPMEDADSPDGVADDSGAGGGGLFTDDEDEEPSANAKGKSRQLDDEGIDSDEDEGPSAVAKGKRRHLDDEEIDSGDDENRDDRAEDAMDVDGKRKKIYLLQLPKHIGIEPKRFDLKTFHPPTTDHHSSGPPSSTFSMHQVSDMTVRWRRSPNDPNVLQSTARILRWEDGSFTLQLASQPLVQHELPAKLLAPPQVNPPKPTPTSIKRAHGAGPVPYNPDLDTHTYLAFPHEAASTIRITNKITTSLQVQSTDDKDVEDDALIRLKESLAAANKSSKGTETMLQITEDPELAKKKAELAEKEKLRAQKRRQNQEEKERDRANRHLGRVGLRTTGAGLTVGGLEDDDGPVRPRAKPARKPRRRNSEYSEDEEDYRNRGKTKEDEYDEDDGFLVGSDEEPEVVEDDDEDEDMEMEQEQPRAKSKSDAREGMKPTTEDAAVRGKRKTVIDDDDDDE